MKRIGVVAYELEGERSGVGRYLEGLLSGLVQVDHDFEWLLFLKGEPFDHPLFAGGLGEDISKPRIVPIFDGRPEGSVILWEQLLSFVTLATSSISPAVNWGSVLGLFEVGQTNAKDYFVCHVQQERRSR